MEYINMKYRILENVYANGDTGWIVQTQTHSNQEWKTESQRIHQNFNKAEAWILDKIDQGLSNEVVSYTILPTEYE